MSTFFRCSDGFRACDGSWRSASTKSPVHGSAKISLASPDLFPALCLLVMKLTFRRLSLTSSEPLAIHGLRSWVLQQLQREGEPLRWAITSIDRSPETAQTAVEVEAVLIHS